ncbi:hypothetical protein ABZ383_00150 [Streptomyces sp. NPDC005900]|uniref:hypothetical protein n=1 Tax=Streptomyces sp. NPDC005900 TaxID=3154569 RepID=UPI0033C55FD3
MSTTSASISSGSSLRIVGVEFGRESVPRSFATLLPPELRESYLRIDPLDNPGIRKAFCTIEEQADHWAAELGRNPNTPTVVLGYCSGSGFASELAARIGSDPVLVLVDPGVPAAEEAQELLAELAETMDEDLAPKDVPDIPQAGPGEAMAVIADFLDTTMQRCAPDLDEEIAEALIGHQRGWMSYTLAAGAHGGTLPTQPAYVLLSDEGEWDDAGPGEVHRFTVGPVALFSLAEAAEAVAGALAAAQR